MQYCVFDDMALCTAQQVSCLLPLVPSFRQDYALRYKHVFGQFCALKSWQMLQPYIGEHVTNLQYTQQGKPFIPGGMEFSISHCKHAIAVAVSERPIGIDVESIRHWDEALVEYTMNEKECAMIREAVQPERMFIRLWTQKEAYLKYLGTGISNQLKNALDHADMEHFFMIEKDHYICSIYHDE